MSVRRLFLILVVFLSGGLLGAQTQNDWEKKMVGHWRADVSILSFEYWFLMDGTFVQKVYGIVVTGKYKVSSDGTLMTVTRLKSGSANSYDSRDTSYSSLPADTGTLFWEDDDLVDLLWSGATRAQALERKSLNSVPFQP